MTEQQHPKRPISSKAAAIRQMAKSPEYQRQVEESRQAEAEAAERATQLAAVQQEALDALNAAGFTVRGIDCSAKTARSLASWVRKHTDGQR